MSDDSVQLNGVFIDDIVVSTGEGTTSFEEDGDVLDGWTVPGAPEGSPPNPNDWIVGTVDDTPPPLGEQVDATFARQPEIIDYLASIFGPYPFNASGGMVDDIDFGFALENQTRPIYSASFFADPIGAEVVVVHELAHQWYGDSLTIAEWQHIWLNEGFATYAEFLWLEREGILTIEEITEIFASIPADDSFFWGVEIGDPGPDNLFHPAVYFRGGMTLQHLRLTVGDAAFFEILRVWAQSQKGDLVTTDEFITLAERISGQELDEFFETWLFTASKPAGLEASAGAAPSSSFGTFGSFEDLGRSDVGKLLGIDDDGMRR